MSIDLKEIRQRPLSLYDKLWTSHVAASYGDDEALIYIDRHLVQEVSSPLAFDGLKRRRLPIRRTDATIAVADHAVPTFERKKTLAGLAAKQVTRLEENCSLFDVPYAPLDGAFQGIVHVIGPELGFTLPGASIVCGDSHTSTHGAFGALAFGIGTSECEAVFATQALRQQKTEKHARGADGRRGARRHCQRCRFSLDQRSWHQRRRRLRNRIHPALT